MADDNRAELLEPAALAASGPEEPRHRFRLLHDVEVELTLEIGRRRMKIADLIELRPGQTIELNKAVGEPIDVYVNGRLLGRGEAVVVADRYGIRFTELVSSEVGAAE